MTGAKDPDEFLRSFGRDAFARLLDQSENYVEYNLRQLQSGYDLTDPLQKAEFARAGAELLASLDSPVEREVYAGQLSEMTGVGKAALLQEIQRVPGPAPARGEKEADPAEFDPCGADSAQGPAAAI